MSTNASFTSDIKLDWAQMACSWSHRSTFLMSAIAKNVSAYCFLASIQSLPICVKSASSTEQRQSTQLLSFAFLPRATCLFWYLSWCDVWCKSIVTKIVRARQYLLVDGVLRIRTFRFVRKIRRGFDKKYCWAHFLIDTCRCFASSPKFVQFPLFCYEIKKDAACDSGSFQAKQISCAGVDCTSCGAVWLPCSNSVRIFENNFISFCYFKMTVLMTCQWWTGSVPNFSLICSESGPASSKFSDLLLFVSYFASLSKGRKFGDYFCDVCFVN